MPGPPPWTTTGFMPTYLRRTTSRETSSRRPGSLMAAPPYLMTIVSPWNSRMYGSASRRVVTSLMAGRCLARVVRVQGHVLLRQVAEEHLRLAALAGKRKDVLDLGCADRLLERAPFVAGHRDRLAAAHELAALDLEVDRERQSRVDQRLAGGLGDRAAVGAGAAQRA